MTQYVCTYLGAACGNTIVRRLDSGYFLEGRGAHVHAHTPMTSCPSQLFVRLFKSWWPHGLASVLRGFFVLGVREAMVMLKSHDFPVKGPADVGC